MCCIVLWNIVIFENLYNLAAPPSAIFYTYSNDPYNSNVLHYRVDCDKADCYHGRLNAVFNAPHPNILHCQGLWLRPQAAIYVTVSSLLKSRTIIQDPYVKNQLAYANFLQSIPPVFRLN